MHARGCACTQNAARAFRTDRETPTLLLMPSTPMQPLGTLHPPTGTLAISAGGRGCMPVGVLALKTRRALFAPIAKPPLCSSCHPPPCNHLARSTHPLAHWQLALVGADACPWVCLHSKRGARFSHRSRNPHSAPHAIHPHATTWHAPPTHWHTGN